MQNAARLRSVTQVSGSLLVDIPTGWEPQRNLVVRALRVAFADFSAAPWQGFEKSERGPNNSSLFQPLAAVVVVAVQVLFRTEKEKPVHNVYWFFLVQLRNQNPNHFPLLWIPLLFQKEWSVYPLYS